MPVIHHVSGKMMAQKKKKACSAIGFITWESSIYSAGPFSEKLENTPEMLDTHEGYEPSGSLTHLKVFSGRQPLQTWPLLSDHSWVIFVKMHQGEWVKKAGAACVGSDNSPGPLGGLRGQMDDTVKVKGTSGRGLLTGLLAHFIRRRGTTQRQEMDDPCFNTKASASRATDQTES